MRIRYALALAVTAAVMVPVAGRAQHGDRTHGQQAVQNAGVDFGVSPNSPTAPNAPVPIGPPPCLQAGAIGGPGDPCSYKLHRLTPEEVTVFKEGQVTFQIHGGGHGFAIYEVSKDTTRDEVGQFLCAGLDPATIADPTLHHCNLDLANANLAHNVLDGHGDVVVAVAANPTNANTHPLNRVWDEHDRRMSAGGQQFLNGGTIPAGAASNGQLVTYQFLKTGRYLVLCINRVHFLNDWMFGFVNVVGGH